MDAVGSTLGNRVPSNKVLIGFLQSAHSALLGSVKSQRVDFGKFLSYEKAKLRKQGRAIEVLQCRNSLHDSGTSFEEKCGLGKYIRKNIAIFVSGGGSNFRSIHNASISGVIHGDVVVLVTDKPGCGGAVYAKDHSIPIIQFPKLRDSLEGLSPMDLVISLRKLKVHFILLAGFLKLIPIELVLAFPRSILNIHPSLLPAFGGKGYYGLKVHKAVVASGARRQEPPQLPLGSITKYSAIQCKTTSHIVAFWNQTVAAALLIEKLLCLIYYQCSP